jgi:hypothetical protein
MARIPQYEAQVRARQTIVAPRARRLEHPQNRQSMAGLPELAIDGSRNCRFGKPVGRLFFCPSSIRESGVFYPKKLFWKRDVPKSRSLQRAARVL